MVFLASQALVFGFELVNPTSSSTLAVSSSIILSSPSLSSSSFVLRRLAAPPSLHLSASDIPSYYLRPFRKATGEPVPQRVVSTPTDDDPGCVF